MKTSSRVWGALLLLVLPAPVPVQGTTFTYQGRLVESGQPANGNYDLQFQLSDAVSGGNHVGTVLTNAPVGVSNGLFVVLLDFGDQAFDGSARWLELGVRTNGSSGAYTVLSPRQAITAAPYAVYANAAGTAAVAMSLAAGGVIAGDGAGITNLDGRSLQPGTINSNKLDVATAAQLALAGSSVGTPTNHSFIMIRPNGRYTTLDGVTHIPPATTTAGIQEAIEALPLSTNISQPGGGTIVFAPGTYFTTTSIIAPASTNPFTLNLIGPGMNAGGITYVGTNRASVIKFGVAGWNDQILNVRDMWIASSLNATTNILWLNGACIGYGVGGGMRGGIAAANIDSCWFGWWKAMTNNSGIGAFTPSQEVDLSKHNLIGIQADGNFANLIIIANNQFESLAIGLAAASDHIAIRNNTFTMCGAYPDQYDIANDWPASSVYSIGGGVCMKEAEGTSSVWNNTFACMIEGNMFIGTAPAYITSLGFKRPHVSYNDSFEMDYRAPMIAANSPWTFINPQGYYYDSNVRYSITNTTDYSTWKNQSATPDQIRILDLGHVFFATGTNMGPLYDGPITLSGLGVKDIPGTNLAPGTVYYQSLATTNVPVAGNVLKYDGTNLYWSTP
jgi:hypothetical protein